MKAIMPKIETVSEPGAIFAKAIKSETISLANYQVVSFVIASAVGADAVKTAVQIFGVHASGKEIPVSFLIKETGSTDTPTIQKEATISIGGKKKSKTYIATITADMLTGTECNAVVLNVNAVDKCEINGAVTVLCERPRYTE